MKWERFSTQFKNSRGGAVIELCLPEETNDLKAPKINCPATGTMSIADAEDFRDLLNTVIQQAKARQ